MRRLAERRISLIGRPRSLVREKDSETRKKVEQETERLASGKRVWETERVRVEENGEIVEREKERRKRE